jgi:hypothetical protein
MNATMAFSEINQLEDMIWPIMISAIFHIFVISLALVGMPYIKKEMPILVNSIAIEIIEVEKEEKIVRQAPYNPSEKIVKKRKPKPPVKIDKKAPPKPEKPPIINDSLEVESVPLPNPTDKPTLPVEEKIEDTEDDFLKVLKNLQDVKQKQVKKETDDHDLRKPSLLTSLSDSMTSGEMEAVKEQLAMCWNVATGARFAEEIVVKVKIFVNPDRKVRDVQIVDMARYKNDSFFRAAADSAINAIYDPRCTPLNLPPDKYKQWEVININFDPREML